VSALLGERALPFLGIPTGPLQVGHFIGALVIVLMAFVEYPGFPLTNLPSPLRGSLQGGKWNDSSCLAMFYLSSLTPSIRALDGVFDQRRPSGFVDFQSQRTRSTSATLGDENLHCGRLGLRPINSVTNVRTAC